MKIKDMFKIGAMAISGIISPLLHAESNITNETNPQQSLVNFNKTHSPSPQEYYKIPYEKGIALIETGANILNQTYNNPRDNDFQHSRIISDDLRMTEGEALATAHIRLGLKSIVYHKLGNLLPPEKLADFMHDIEHTDFKAEHFKSDLAGEHLPHINYRNAILINLDLEGVQLDSNKPIAKYFKKVIIHEGMHIFGPDEAFTQYLTNILFPEARGTDKSVVYGELTEFYHQLSDVIGKKDFIDAIMDSDNTLTKMDKLIKAKNPNLAWRDIVQTVNKILKFSWAEPPKDLIIDKKIITISKLSQLLSIAFKNPQKEHLQLQRILSKCRDLGQKSPNIKTHEGWEFE